MTRLHLGLATWSSRSNREETCSTSTSMMAHTALLATDTEVGKTIDNSLLHIKCHAQLFEYLVFFSSHPRVWFRRCGDRCCPNRDCCIRHMKFCFCCHMDFEYLNVVCRCASCMQILEMLDQFSNKCHTATTRYSIHHSYVKEPILSSRR